MSDQTAAQSRQGSSSRMSRAAAHSSPGLPQQRRFDGAASSSCTSSQPSSTTLPRLTRHMLTDAESWVEVASQPSSSSLSSIGDEIVTTGLRVGGPYGPRRRRLQPAARSLTHQQTAVHATEASSQEEYDESETDSEDDHVLTSSNENLHQSEDEVHLGSENDSEADNLTALGRVSDRPVFQPQPNAFSHPPTHLHHRSHSDASCLPPTHPHRGLTRPSFSQRSQTRAGPNFMSPSVREENDAALRASLTTLLSCAAAARGLPKTKDEAEAQQRAPNMGVGPSNQMEFRLVPESELEAEQSRARRTPTPTASSPRKRGSSARSLSRGAAVVTDKAKSGAASGSAPRATKKKKTAAVAPEETLISPTLLTWVVSAGVVVLVSVVGFGAGYVIGREVGKQEALAASMGSVNDTTSCSNEVIRHSGSGLRRIKWGVVGRSMVA